MGRQDMVNRPFLVIAVNGTCVLFNKTLFCSFNQPGKVIEFIDRHLSRNKQIDCRKFISKILFVIFSPFKQF